MVVPPPRRPSRYKLKRSTSFPLLSLSATKLDHEGDPVTRAFKQEEERERPPVVRRWVADNDDSLPSEILAIVKAMARAAARRDHHAATEEIAGRD